MEEIKWTLGRIIDFEYFLRQDSLYSDQSYLEKRDREIYLNRICSKDVTSPGERLLLWLEAMKEYSSIGSNTGNVIDGDSINKSFNHFSPGAMYEELLSLLRTLFLIIGSVAGVLICLTFFSYTGSQPLNVSYFLALTLLPQIGLIMTLLVFFLIVKFNLIHIKKFTPYPFLALLVKNSLMALNRRAMAKLAADKRESVQAAFAIISEGQQIYGLLFFWPLFILMQLFAIAFNMGILLSTLFRILFFDTAFGWQSTLQMSAQMVSKIVSVVAAPWGWFLTAGKGFPDLEQIIGSRIILKDGIYHLTTYNLVSWWPFMCLAVIFYGLLPRVIMLVSGLVSLKHSLERQTFDHGGCSKLLRRMLMANSAAEFRDKALHAVAKKSETSQSETAQIATKQSDISNIVAIEAMGNHHIVASAVEEEKEEDNNKPVTYNNIYDEPPPLVEKKSPHSNLATAASRQVQMKPSIALVPDDIHDLIDRETFVRLMRELHGYDIKKIVITGIDFDSEMECVKAEYAAVKSRDIKADGWGVVVLQEAWQPPIRETINFIKGVRAVVDKKSSIMVALTGKVTTDKTAGDGTCSRNVDGDQHGVTVLRQTDSDQTRADNFFTPADLSDLDIWKMKLSTVADPWLTLESVL